MRAAFVYANARTPGLSAIAAGHAPDTALLGLNHLADHGIDAWVADAPEPAGPAVVRRAEWHLRELVMPWRVGDADVVVTTLAPLLALAARARPRLRCVVLNMGLVNRLRRTRGPGRALVRTGVRAADAVVCFAESQRRELTALAGADAARTVTLELGVDAAFLRPQGPPPRDGYVLAVGRDVARDYATFADALRGLDARAVVVASRRNLAGVDLPPNVEVQVDVDAPALRDLYEGARCVVVATRRESFPYGADCSGQTVVLDAMAMGRPVVASSRGTLDGYVADGVTGLLVPPEEPQALRAAVERLAADDELAQRLGAAGRAAVEASLTTRHLAARLARVLHGLGPR
jgi:glycosyltransferase involved in cell wall biosynthesis